MEALEEMAKTAKRVLVLSACQVPGDILGALHL